MVKLNEEFANYKEMLSKMNVSLWDFDYLDENCVITLTTETFKKLGRKNFPKKATFKTTETISARQYALYLTSIAFFEDKVTNAYTIFGYKPARLTCVSPNKETKIIRSFKFEN